MAAVLFLPFFRRVKRLLFSPKKSATATTADTDANKINIQFHRTRTFHNDIFASAMWQGWQNPISCDDEPALHFLNCLGKNEVSSNAIQKIAMLPVKVPSRGLCLPVLRQGIMRCHVHLNFSRKHFRGVAASRRAWMGMARYYDGFSRPCLCYPVGGAGETGKMRIMAVKAAGCPLKSVFSMAKIQTNIKVSGFRLIGNIDLGG